MLVDLDLLIRTAQRQVARSEHDSPLAVSVMEQGEATFRDELDQAGLSVTDPLHARAVILGAVLAQEIPASSIVFSLCRYAELVKR